MSLGRSGWVVTWIIGAVAAAGLAPSGCGGGGGGHAVQGMKVGPDVDGQLSINEIMSLNALTTKDENGLASAWFEISNPTGEDIALDGYSVTDDFNTPGKSVLPSGAAVPAHGYLILWADQNPAAGATHTALVLPATGGSIGLARPDGSFIDRVTFGA